MRRLAGFLWLAAVGVVDTAASPSSAFAQSPDTAQAVPPVTRAATTLARPTIIARRTDTAPTIDGSLNDSVWTSATRVAQFVQERPVEGSPATEMTEVSLAYDSQHVYFGIYAHYSDSSLIRANRVDRDRTENDDTITVLFDPFLDLQRAYAFSVNGYGVQRDFLMTGGGSGSSGDDSWNALFDSAAVLVEDGWTAEMAIPFKSLRYPARRLGEMHRWGFQIQRTVQSKNESVVWAPVTRDVAGFLRQMGVLEGMTDLSTQRNFELLPTATAIQAGHLDAKSGAYSTDHLTEAGMNVKYGITPDLTFDFTYNPDFSQIESDRPQIEVNQRFPILYPELRPFFLEGREIYEIPGPVTVVHTRTIVDPRYGAKLTGKIGRTAVGLIVADDEAPGKVDSPVDPAFGHAAQVVLARARYDMPSGSNIGLLFTDREFLNSSSRLLSLDDRWEIGRNHRMVFRAMTAHHRDQAGVKRTGEMIQFGWNTDGRHVSFMNRTHILDPDFRTDVGFVRRTDERRTRNNFSYRWWPERWLINWGPDLNYERNYDHKWVLQDDIYGGGFSFQFAKNIRTSASMSREMERYRDIDFWKTRYSLSADVATSRRFAVGASVSTGDQIRFIANPFLGSATEAALTLTVRPVSRLFSEVRLNTSRFVDRQSGAVGFDAKIFRAMTTYQFSDRLLIRNIAEHDSFNGTVGANVLVTYRVNAGTVFFLGYDDRYREGDQIDPLRFPTSEWQRTNRAIFTKLQYLFRY